MTTKWTVDSLPPCPNCGSSIRHRAWPEAGLFVHCSLCGWEMHVPGRVEPLTVATAPWTRDLWAEVERLRAERSVELTEVQQLMLAWIPGPNGSWALGPIRDGWANSPYSAFETGAAASYSTCGAACMRNERLANIEAAVLRIAIWARADGHPVPLHPLGWNIGEVTRD